ncbi:MAG: SH3 domain-containing protein [Candidatus Omnitrophica bacterium]|nr:SH3 domain-containing protein [Candidatus Omnitrophota bacterium]
MRNVLFLSLCFFLLASGFCASQKTKAVKEAILRTDSTTLAEEITKIAEGTSLEIVQQKYDWCKVRLPLGFTGFVYASYIETKNEKVGYSQADNLNIRTQPSIEAVAIGKLQKNDKVEILSKDNGWYKINAYPYATAWVHKNSLEQVPEKAEINSQGPSGTIDKDIQKEEIQEKQKTIEKKPEIAKAAPDEEKTKEETQVQKSTPAIQQTQTPKETKPQKKIKDKLPTPIASGVLKNSGRIFSSINYKLENKNGIVFLKIPESLKPGPLLNKEVNVWGKLQKNQNYLLVDKISLKEAGELNKVKQELQEIGQNLENALIKKE